MAAAACLASLDPLDPEVHDVTTRTRAPDPSAALAAMTPGEKVALLTGRDPWSPR